MSDAMGGSCKLFDQFFGCQKNHAGKYCLDVMYSKEFDQLVNSMITILTKIDGGIAVPPADLCRKVDCCAYQKLQRQMHYGSEYIAGPGAQLALLKRCVEPVQSICPSSS
jgi:hypothetical protein